MYSAFVKRVNLFKSEFFFYKIGTFRLEIKTASSNAWNSNANEKLRNMVYPSI